MNRINMRSAVNDCTATRFVTIERPNRTGCTNIEYIAINPLFHNIAPTREFTHTCAGTADLVIRPVALFDLAYRDLQTLNGKMPMSQPEARRYIRTIEYCKKFFKRVYYGMSETQVAVLNDAMAIMEEEIERNYDVLKYSIHLALAPYFEIEHLRNIETLLCLIHVCADLPYKYIMREFKTDIPELREISKNVNMFMHFICELDPADGTANLNNDKAIEEALRAFQCQFYQIKLS